MSRRVIFDLRLGDGDDGEREAVAGVHHALAAWSDAPDRAIIATPYGVLVDAPAHDLDRLLDELADEILSATRELGGHLAVGVAVGPGWPLLLADGRRAHGGSVVRDAARAAELACPDGLMLTGGARAATNGPWRFGERQFASTELGGPKLSCYPLLWDDSEWSTDRRHRRRRGTVIRRIDGATLILGDDDRMYRAQHGEQLVEDLPLESEVWFVADTDTRGPGDVSRAFATSRVGARLTGTVGRRGSQTLLRSFAESGHWMTFRARPSDMLAEAAQIGDRLDFSVTSGTRGPGADDLKPVETVTPTVLERVLIGCMDELTSNQASGAAAAVRRSTKALTTDAEPAWERQRLWHVLEHARTEWAVPALGLSQYQYLAAGLRSIEGVHDADSAELLWLTLGEYLKGHAVVKDRTGAELTPVLTAVRMAAQHASRIDTRRDDPLEVDHMARAATFAGQAMAQALLCGVIAAVPTEAKKLGRELVSIGPAM